MLTLSHHCYPAVKSHSITTVWPILVAKVWSADELGQHWKHTGYWSSSFQAEKNVSGVKDHCILSPPACWADWVKVAELSTFFGVFNILGWLYSFGSLLPPVACCILLLPLNWFLDLGDKRLGRGCACCEPICSAKSKGAWTGLCHVIVSHSKRGRFHNAIRAPPLVKVLCKHMPNVINFNCTCLLYLHWNDQHPL